MLHQDTKKEMVVNFSIFSDILQISGEMVDSVESLVAICAYSGKLWSYGLRLQLRQFSWDDSFKEYSKNSALSRLLRLRWFEGGQDGFIEDILQSSLSQSRALHVLDCFEFLRQLLPQLVADGLLLILRQLLHCGSIVSQVNLSPHQKERSLLTVMSDLWHPLNRRMKWTWEEMISLIS